MNICVQKQERKATEKQYFSCDFSKKKNGKSMAVFFSVQIISADM